MWSAARDIVKNVFFKDKVELYKSVYTESDIGEDIEELVLVGVYYCNIEENATELLSKESGQVLPRTLRISMPKDVMLSDGETYSVKILEARIVYNSEVMLVSGWVEGQISTVLTVKREVAV